MNRGKFITVLVVVLAGFGCEELGIGYEWDTGLGDSTGGEIDTRGPIFGPSTDDTEETDPTVEGCGGMVCSEYQYCDEETQTCVKNSCETLECDPKAEECIETPSGAICDSISCDRDEDCLLGRYCDLDEKICKDDQCIPGEKICENPHVLICAGNGADFEVLVSCTSEDVPSGYKSGCIEISEGVAGCGCTGDWDCPNYQECEAGTCTGSPKAPECILEPREFGEVPPKIEIQWGGLNENNQSAVLKVNEQFVGTDIPWSEFGQVVQTPMVANLDDDNGDGKIDDRDVPEIIFLSFAEGVGAHDNMSSNGMIRAIHGGGVRADGSSKKGETLLSVCGGNRYYNGNYYDSNGQHLSGEPNCYSNDPQFDATSTLAIGDVDYDGKPDIVAIGEQINSPAPPSGKSQGYIAIFDNEGRLKAKTDLLEFGRFSNPAPTLANVIVAEDKADELVEIVVGRDLFTLKRDGDGISFDHRFTGTDAYGANGQGPVSCVADLIPDEQRPGMEIVAGATVYGIPLKSDGTLNTGSSSLVVLADMNRDGFCGIADVWGEEPSVAPGPFNRLDGKPEIVVVSGGRLYIYGFEVNGNPDSPTMTELKVLTLPYEVPEDITGGGAPNIDDFDGDGFPEIGTAGKLGYKVFDLQNSTTECPAWTSSNDSQSNKPRAHPGGECTNHEDCGGISQFACRYSDVLSRGECICLHNGWQRATQDASSRVTGSSVFDFNGDGSAEVIYNDECHFRIYSGFNGEEIKVEPSESRTRIEYPIVADVDNDGNAEIVFATSNESGFCTYYGTYDGQLNGCDNDNDCNVQQGERCAVMEGYKFCSKHHDRSQFNNGIEVWGDPTDTWVSARRIWNQHAYHVTNVNEDGTIPIVEPKHWLPLGPRHFNTYRSQPRSFGVAPDLVVDSVQVSSPDVGCGELSSEINIAVQISNIGDLRVGAGVPVVFQGKFGATEEILKDQDGETLVLTLPASLLPGESNMFQVSYLVSNNGKTDLPETITAIIDPSSDIVVLDNDGIERPDGYERECNEDNNRLPVEVVAAGALADLWLTLEHLNVFGCPATVPTLTGKVHNDGAFAAEDITVHIFVGDPSSGGSFLAETTVERVEADAEVSFTAELPNFPIGKTVTLFAIVDPQNQIDECNDGNNKAGPTEDAFCGTLLE